MSSNLRLCVAAIGLALLGACGGGSDPAPVVPDSTATLVTEPDSATASIDAFASFTSRVIVDAKASETAAPILLNDVSAPTSETASPVAVVD